MIWVRFLVLASFLAQQGMCCCAGGCSAPSADSLARAHDGSAHSCSIEDAAADVAPVPELAAQSDPQPQTSQRPHNDQTTVHSCSHGACKHSHASAPAKDECAVAHREKEIAATASAPVEGWYEVPSPAHSHDHHLCVATHLFYISNTPVSTQVRIDFNWLCLPPATLPNVAERFSAFTKATNNLSRQLMLIDRSALQVYTL